jgi:hypothetical protein
MRRDAFLPFAIAGVLALVLLGPRLPQVQAGEKSGEAAKLYGRIQFVTSFPDYKVRVVNSFPDLRVQMVDAFPDAPGKWQKVDSHPDFKVQIVDSFPDVTIQYVENFPGPAK